MNDLKEIIDKDIDNIIPAGYYNRIHQQVMKSIYRQQKSYMVSPIKNWDDVSLLIMIILCVLFIYFFGFNEYFKLRIYVNNSLIVKFLAYFFGMITLFVFFVNDYFDRKKMAFV